MSSIFLAPRQASVLWSGDVVVLGATWAGLAAAQACAARGWRTCLLESGPALGTETSAWWRTDLPDGPCFQRARALAEGKGMPAGGIADVVLTTIAFDQVMAEAGVACFVRVMPTRAVAGEGGLLDGVEVVGKSGRQLVRAKLIIDATPQRGFARNLANQPLHVAGRVVRRLYAAGVSLPPEGREWEAPDYHSLGCDWIAASPAAWGGEAIVAFSMKTSASEGQAQILARSLTLGGDLFAWLRTNAPEFAEANLVDVSPGVESVAVIPALPGLAAAGVWIAPEKPAHAADGVATLALSPSIPLPLAPNGAGETVETFELFAASEQDLPPCELPAAPARKHEPSDVVVAGYGTGGAFAALAAAEEGLSVTVVDPAPVPGGIGSAGRIHSYYHGLKGGMQDRLDEGILGRGAREGKTTGYHPVGRAEVVSQAMASQAGLTVRAGHFVFGVVRENQRVVAVLSAAEDGYHVFPCQIAIDGTGDGDLAAAAGAPMTLGRVGDGFPQPYSYTPSLVAGGTLRHHNFDAGWVDPTDTIDFSRAHFEGRERIWNWREHTPASHYCTLASIIGIRESRFVQGPLTLTFEDFMQGRTYPDTVCSSRAHHDNHAMDYAEESEWGRRHVIMFGLWQYLLQGDIPYRALLPGDVEGLLIACRALSVRQGVFPRNVDIAELRAALKTRGIGPSPTQPVLDLPNDELLARLGKEGEAGLAMWRLAQRTGSEAPDWEAFLSNETDADRRFRGAVAAAEAGISTPAVLAELGRSADSLETGAPLGRKSPARCIVAALALADIGAPGTAARIGAILESDIPVPTDALLLLKALAYLGDPAGVGVVKRFLAASEGKPFLERLWGVSDGCPTSFRYAVEIRAVRTLIALGCRDELSRLDPYLSDPLLLIRRHARRVLAEAGPLLA
jgi:flavin-dependent dehydrogenase